MMASSPCSNNQRPRSVNDLRPSILENQGGMQRQWSTIVLLAGFLSKYAYNKIITMSQNEHQQSINNCCAGILDDITGMEHRYTIMNLAAAFMGKNASVNIASPFYNWARMVRQRFESYTTINCGVLFLNGGSRGQLLQSVLVFNITNMNAVSDWSDYLPSSGKVNI